MILRLASIVAQTGEIPGVGAEDLAEFWPLVVRAAWFLAAFVVVVLVGWYVLEPALSRAIRRRNDNNPTIHPYLAP